MRSTTHFCLAFDPIIANVTPSLDSRFRPNQVVLLVCPERQEQARWLENTLKKLHIDVTQCQINDAWDVDHIRSCVEGYLARFKDGDGIALNVTGGTKPMSVAAYEAFRGAGKPIFYVHHERDHVVWMHPHDTPSFDLADKIDMPTFLSVHGSEIVGTVNKAPIDGRWSALTAELIRNIEKYTAPLSELNRLASNAEKSLRVVFRENDYSKRKKTADLLPGLKELVDLFRRHKLLELDKNSSSIVFASEKCRFYVNGGWLEEHVLGLIQKMKRDMDTIHDFGRSLKVVRKNRGGEVENELDVALLADNKLHIVECKTKRFEFAGDDSGAAESLYKLDTLRDHVGGLQARGMLVSYKPLKQEHLWRAKDLGIETCFGADIQNLQEKLKKWIGSKC